MNLRDILNTTKNFYKDISEEFSNTRQYPWKGWEKCLRIIDIPDKYKVEDTLKIADLGCGNGRFLDFIQKNITKVRIEYTGYDTDESLLKIAQRKFANNSNIGFLQKDIINNIKEITQKYDLVVAFGITHHIPQKDFRIRWFKELGQIIEDEGYLVLSFWNFLNKKTLVKATELEENDYWLSWNNNNKIKRFCHFYDQAELKIIDEILKELQVNLVAEIKNEEDRNIYKIYRKGK